MSDTLAIAAVIVAGLFAILWLRRVATRGESPRVSCSSKAYEHVAAGRLTPEQAADALMGIDDGCAACEITARTARILPDGEHECLRVEP